MKITIIYPRYPFSERVPVIPPILEYLAALTLREAPSVTVELIDANESTISPEELNTDLIAISVMTPTAPWSYAFADNCRARGIPVVLGGIHPTVLPQEAAQHADSIVVGEAEAVWGQVLVDAAKGSLQPFYYGQQSSLQGLPLPLKSGLKGRYRFRAFFTMRGCPYPCTFCNVRQAYGPIIRYRPNDEVALEIDQRAGKMWFNGDDNIWGGDIDRNINLFTELAHLSKRNWFGFGDLKTVQQEKGSQLIKAARKSGLFSIMVGWESDSSAILTNLKAQSKQGQSRIEAIRQIQAEGIYVTLFTILGSRADDAASFERTLELADSLNVGVHPIMLMPMPGTELYEEYREYLLPDLGWEDFSGTRALFTHPDPEMTPVKREEHYHKLRLKLFELSRILKRISKIPLKSFPSAHLLNFVKEVPMKKQVTRAYDNWQAANFCCSEGAPPPKGTST